MSRTARTRAATRTRAAPRRTTRLALFAVPALLAAQCLAAEETEQALSASPPAQAAQGLDAATRLFAPDQEGTSAPASTDPATLSATAPDADRATARAPVSGEPPATEKKPEIAGAGPDDPNAGSDPNAGAGGSGPKQDMSQVPATTATHPSEPAPAPEPGVTVPFNAGSLPRVRSLAEGQAQLARAAAAQVATQVGFVSVGPALRVEMVYGQSWPTLVCKYNLTCLLELEPGEEIADTQILADSVRWEAALRYREQPVTQAYIAFKPRPDAQETNFVLVTNRRVYSILLVPDPVVHTPILSFRYPDTQAAEMARRIDAQKQAERTRASAARAARQAAVRQSGVPTVRGAVPADELDFNYRITGRAPFRPVRIYTDGRRTYIDLPARYRGELPVLLASSANTNSAVNITVGKNGTQLIADKELTAFVLVVGRQRVSVRKGG